MEGACRSPAFAFVFGRCVVGGAGLASPGRVRGLGVLGVEAGYLRAWFLKLAQKARRTYWVHRANHSVPPCRATPPRNRTAGREAVHKRPAAVRHVQRVVLPRRLQPGPPVRARELQAGCWISCLAGHGLELCPVYGRTWSPGVPVKSENSFYSVLDLPRRPSTWPSCAYVWRRACMSVARISSGRGGPR